MRVRSAAWAVGLTIALGAATACSAAEDPGGEPSPGSASGGIIKVGVAQLPPGNGDPYQGQRSPAIYTLAAIYDTLALTDTVGVLQPALATEWDTVDDTTWQFTLRDGVTFSNGEVFDADAVVAAFDYVLNDEEGQQSVVAPDLATITDVRAVDPLTVEFTTEDPDPILAKRVAGVYIPAPEAFASLGPVDFAAEPVGTGPFQVEDWGPNSVTLVPFEDSWRAPIADGLEINALPEPAARLQALQSGQINLAVQLEADQAEQIAGDPELSAVADPTVQVMSLAFINTLGDTPLQDVRVRQALNYAVDKQSISESLLLGRGDATGQGVTPQAFGYDPSIEPYPYDPERARDLLADAGYADGFSLTAKVVVGSFPADSLIYQYAQQNLAEVGVDLELQTVTFADWLGLYQNNAWEEEQAFGLSWNSAPLLDAARPLTIFSCLQSAAFHCNERVVPLLEEQAREVDPQRREQLLHEIIAIYHEEPPALWLVQQVDINGVANELVGYENIIRTFPYHQMAVNS